MIILIPNDIHRSLYVCDQCDIITPLSQPTFPFHLLIYQCMIILIPNDIHRSLYVCDQCDIITPLSQPTFPFHLLTYYYTTVPTNLSVPFIDLSVFDYLSKGISYPSHIFISQPSPPPSLSLFTMNGVILYPFSNVPNRNSPYYIFHLSEMECSNHIICCNRGSIV